MSLTMTVPAADPSLFHSSHPWAPSQPGKYMVPLTGVNPLPTDWADAALMSTTMAVLAVGPADRQISRPWVPSSALKYSHPPEAYGLARVAVPTPGLSVLTRTVPAAVPFVFQSWSSPAAFRAE